ncbi:MAG: hypothetical protein IKQ17_11765 [Kiritimatiellae bacterium]|nr:hypothetical protein [Kiritimatiellia bacterium]
MRKRIGMFLAAAMAAVLAAAGMTAMADSPMVSNVTAKQQWPWKWKVDITYTLSAGFPTLTMPCLSVTVGEL